jgi:hypothetical protein
MRFSGYHGQQCGFGRARQYRGGKQRNNKQHAVGRENVQGVFLGVLLLVLFQPGFELVEVADSGLAAHGRKACHKHDSRIPHDGKIPKGADHWASHSRGFLFAESLRFHDQELHASSLFGATIDENLAEDDTSKY